MEPKRDLYLRTRRRRSFAEELADTELPQERRGWPRGRQRGLAQGCAVKLTRSRVTWRRWQRLESGLSLGGERQGWGAEREDPGDKAVLLALGLIGLEAASTYGEIKV